jgi:hypothetical protein
LLRIAAPEDTPWAIVAVSAAALVLLSWQITIQRIEQVHMPNR